MNLNLLNGCEHRVMERMRSSSYKKNDGADTRRKMSVSTGLS